ncbi:MAG TPA: iron ABC transporter permease, partial [Deltaproteobacteria bacterium]|nr:iron ABC transporter permease [Deltaproteobacteria bacterium]
MRRAFVFILLVLFCAASVILALLTGGTELPAGEIIRTLLHPSSEGVTHTLIWELRIPRIFTAGIVGAALASCGVVFQAILRNPLAEPYTLGVSGGGALGATIAILLGISGLPMAAICFAGCCLSIAIVLGAASLKRFTDSTLILSGVIMSFIFSSAVMFIFSVASSREVHASILWLMGSLSAPPQGSIPMLLATLPIMAVLLLSAKDLNLLSLGDESSYHLGLNAKKAKGLLLLTASLI